MKNIKDSILTLDDINTHDFQFNPKSRIFEKKLIEISEELGEEIYNVNRKKSLIYISLMYEFNSQLRNMFPNLLDRKRNASIIAGFSMSTGEFAEEVQRCILGQNERFNKKIVKYLSLSNSIDFMTYAVLEDVLYHWLEDSLKKPSKGAQESIIKLRAQLDSLRQSLFGGEETQDLKKALYEGAATVRLKLTVEDTRELMKENGLEEFNPYPDKYKPNQLKYAGDELQ